MLKWTFAPVQTDILSRRVLTSVCRVSTARSHEESWMARSRRVRIRKRRAGISTPNLTWSKKFHLGRDDFHVLPNQDRNPLIIQGRNCENNIGITCKWS